MGASPNQLTHALGNVAKRRPCRYEGRFLGSLGMWQAKRTCTPAGLRSCVGSTPTAPILADAGVRFV